MSINRQRQDFVELCYAIIEKGFAQPGTDSGFERHVKVYVSIKNGSPGPVLSVEKTEFSTGLQMRGSFHFAYQVCGGSLVTTIFSVNECHVPGSPRLKQSLGNPEVIKQKSASMQCICQP